MRLSVVTATQITAMFNQVKDLLETDKYSGENQITPKGLGY